MHSGEESLLVQQAKSDPGAFGQLYRQYVKRIYNYHYRHTSNVAEAEDLTSNTFYRALRSITQYNEKGASFQAWIFRIAHNLVVNWYRDRSRHPTVSIEDVPPMFSEEDAPHDYIESSEDIQYLLNIFKKLPEARKTLLILKFVEDMTNYEIATVLGRTEGAIKALYHRTLLNLRQQMAKKLEFES